MYLLKQEKEPRQLLPSFKETNSLLQRINLRLKFEEKYPKSRYALVVLNGLDDLGFLAKNFNMYTCLYLAWALRMISQSWCWWNT
jgi:hypothetical protein